MDLPVDVFYLLFILFIITLHNNLPSAGNSHESRVQCAKFIFVFAVIETAFGVAFIGRAHSLEWDFAKLITHSPLIILYVSSTHCSLRIFFFLDLTMTFWGGGGGGFLNVLLFKLCKTPLLIMSISILRVLITSLN